MESPILRRLEPMKVAILILSGIARSALLILEAVNDERRWDWSKYRGE